jgi:hypothetical protein
VQPARSADPAPVAVHAADADAFTLQSPLMGRSGLKTWSLVSNQSAALRFGAGVDGETERRVAAASAEQVEVLAERVLSAATLAELLAD